MSNQQANPAGTSPGSIDFPCTSCGKLLKVALAAAGKKAQCPSCKSILTVPEAATTAASPASGGTLPPEVSSGLAGQNLSSFQEASVPGDSSAGLFGDSPSTSADGQSIPTRRSVPDFDPQPIRQLFRQIQAEVRKVYIGQDEMILSTLVALFSSGHVLIESVPGLGKTLFVRTLGRVLGCQFGRIQFTADLMPSDITGAPIYDMKTQEFRFHPGPVFTQLLLADEINRSPAKTHAALLEIMQEYRVTVERTTHRLERPFLVLATQNPMESEGTYNLPEAQLDRFMFKIIADYPSAEEEANVLRLHSQQQDLDKRLAEDVQTVTSAAEIMQVTTECSKVLVEDKLIDYINSIVRLTRSWPDFHMGASPRAGIALMQGVRVLAAFNGRDYAVPDDVVQIAIPALRHRVILTAESDVQGHKVDDLLVELIRSVEVPRI